MMNVINKQRNNDDCDKTNKLGTEDVSQADRQTDRQTDSSARMCRLTGL